MQKVFIGLFVTAAVSLLMGCAEQDVAESAEQRIEQIDVKSTQLKVTREDIVSALDDYDTAANFDASMAGGMDPAISDAIRSEAFAALEAAESATAGRKAKARSTILQVDDAEAAVYKNAFAFATVAYADDAIQAAITAYAEKARTLTVTVAAAEAEIDAAAGDYRDRSDHVKIAAAQARKVAAAHELALHYADATAYATAQEEMSYYSAEEESQAIAEARKVVDASMNVTNAREAALKASRAASAGEADYQASSAGFTFANAIYSLQVAYENRAKQALYEAREKAVNRLQ